MCNLIHNHYEDGCIIINTDPCEPILKSIKRKQWDKIEIKKCKKYKSATVKKSVKENCP
jgi:hypothetical protein